MFIKKKKTIAIFDIGSSSIGVAIATFSTDPKKTQILPVISLAKRYQLQISEKITFKSFINIIFTAFDKSAEEISRKKIKIDKVVIFLASPFYLSKTNIIKKSGDNILVSDTLIKSLIEAKSQSMIKNQPVLYPDLIGDESYVFENNIMQIKLNDYQTNNPYGKKVKSLSVVNYSALGSKKIATKLKEVIIRRLGRLPVDFHSFTFAAFSVWQEIISSNKRNFMLLDITGEISDVTVVTDDYLVENVSFPRGRNYLIRETAKALKTNNEEALSTLKEYATGNLDEYYKKNLETVLQPIKKEWIKSLSEAFTLIMESVLLPETVYTIGDDVTARIFALWLEEKELAHFSLVNKPLVSHFIDESKWGEYCIDQSHQKTKDSFLGIETLFCQKNL